MGTTLTLDRERADGLTSGYHVAHLRRGGEVSAFVTAGYTHELEGAYWAGGGH